MRDALRQIGTSKHPEAVFLIFMPNFEHHVFVCLNERDETAARPSCGHKHSKKIRNLMKDAVKEAGLKGRVRVNEAGCWISASMDR